MRTKIVAGNWKMNKNLQESLKWVADLKNELQNFEKQNTRIIIAPNFISLNEIQKQTKNSILEVAAQNAHYEDKGAFTGEIAMEMLKNIAINMVILGHSERRMYFGENDAILKKKVRAALENHMEIIFCVGETLTDRKAGNHFKIVKAQIKNVLFDLPEHAWENIILAYEPVWAIGTGETATATEAQEMHHHIRNCIKEKYNHNLAENVSILYGGSCKPNNAREIFEKKDVDGGLIGGASLQKQDFTAIIKSI